MNREMRRAAVRAKRMEVKPRRNWSRITRPMLHEADQVFGPIDAFLKQLQSGVVDAAAGRAVFKDTEGHWYEATPAVRGFVSAFERILTHYQIELNLEPVLKLCNKLDAGMPLTLAHIAQCTSLIDQCRRAYMGMDVFVVKGIVNTELIALELEQRQLVPETA